MKSENYMNAAQLKFASIGSKFFTFIRSKYFM